MSSRGGACFSGLRYARCMAHDGPYITGPLPRSGPALKRQIALLSEFKQGLEGSYREGRLTDDPHGRIRRLQIEIERRQAALGAPHEHHEDPPGGWPSRSQHRTWDPVGAEYEALIERVKASPLFHRLMHNVASQLALEELAEPGGMNAEPTENVRGFAQRLVADVLSVAFLPKAAGRAIDELRTLLREHEERENRRPGGGWWAGLHHLFARYPHDFPVAVRNQIAYVCRFLALNYPELRVRLRSLSVEKLAHAETELQTIADASKRGGRRPGPWSMAERVANALGFYMPERERDVARSRGEPN